MSSKLSVKQTAADKWAVLDGEHVLAEFPTNGEAWRWLDKHERRATWVRRETADWRGHGVYHDVKERKQ